jgi:hypothetical protein
VLSATSNGEVKNCKSYIGVRESAVTAGRMIVLIAGMPRSGSTFSFNVVRDILRVRGTLHQEACEDLVGAIDRAGNARHVLVKAHSLDQPSMDLAKAGAFKVVITVRRLEDTIASWLNAFDTLPEQTATVILHRWLNMYQELRDRALVIPYEEIDQTPRLAVRRIARGVCAKVGAIELLRIAHRWEKARVKRRADRIIRGSGVHDLGWSYYDTETFLHRRHISEHTSRTADERAGPERLARIRAALAENVAAVGLT